jgi:hypothetical protein
MATDRAPLLAAGIPLVLGLLGLLVLWWSKRLRRRGIWLALAALIAIGLLGGLSSRIVWDGGYCQAEYQLTFVDENGAPIPAVELRVEDAEGHNFFHYPVTDYLPDRTIVSNSDGLIVFHHVGGGPEFSGEVDSLYGVIPVVKRRGPKFICRFVYQESEIHRVAYSDLNSDAQPWESAPKVKRWWTWSAWPMSELLLSPEESLDDFRARAKRFFDLDHDGVLSPEEAAAFRAGTSRNCEEAALARRSGVDKEEELEFQVIRRTIAVPFPRR